jgi:hypothetical protein
MPSNNTGIDKHVSSFGARALQPGCHEVVLQTLASWHPTTWLMKSPRGQMLSPYSHNCRKLQTSQRLLQEKPSVPMLVNAQSIADISRRKPMAQHTPSDQANTSIQ